MLEMLERLKFWQTLGTRKVYRTKPARLLPRMLQEEVRTVLTVATSGDNVILPAQNKWEVEVISVTVQPTNNPVNLALKEKNFFISPVWQLQILQFAVLPGKIIDRNHDLILNLSGNISVNVQVRWIPYTRREYRPEWGQLGER